MTVTFQVGDRENHGSGNLEIDFWVRRLPSLVLLDTQSPRSQARPTDGHLGTLRVAWVGYCANTSSKQIQQPGGSNQIHQSSVRSGDHSFEARADGRYTYCFSNEHWSANTKEVSFNVHGIVYVPDTEIQGDPLEKEGKSALEQGTRWLSSNENGSDVRHSKANVRTPFSGQRRTRIHCCARTNASQHRRIDEFAREVVEYLPTRHRHRGGHLPGLVAEAFL